MYAVVSHEMKLLWMTDVKENVKVNVGWSLFQSKSDRQRFVHWSCMLSNDYVGDWNKTDAILWIKFAFWMQWRVEEMNRQYVLLDIAAASLLMFYFVWVGGGECMCLMCVCVCVYVEYVHVCGCVVCACVCESACVFQERETVREREYFRISV